MNSGMRSQDTWRHTSCELGRRNLRFCMPAVEDGQWEEGFISISSYGSWWSRGTEVDLVKSFFDTNCHYVMLPDQACSPRHFLRWYHILFLGSMWKDSTIVLIALDKILSDEAAMTMLVNSLQSSASMRILFFFFKAEKRNVRSVYQQHFLRNLCALMMRRYYRSVINETSSTSNFSPHGFFANAGGLYAVFQRKPDFVKHCQVWNFAQENRWEDWWLRQPHFYFSGYVVLITIMNACPWSLQHRADTKLLSLCQFWTNFQILCVICLKIDVWNTGKLFYDGPLACTPLSRPSFFFEDAVSK